MENDYKPQKMRLQKRTACERCGKCCTGSSPSLLKEDMALFTGGVLSYSDAVTVRDGERLCSYSDGRIYESFMELVKIRCREHSSVCIFYSNEDGCRIYENRPAQCRKYECWSPMDLYSGLGSDALGRKELFNGVDVLMEIIGKHEARCSYKGLSHALERLAEGDEAAVEEVMDMLQYDTYIRPFLTEKFDVPEGALDLVLGRPLIDAVNEFGFKVVSEGEEYVLMPIDDKK
jgi:Fe-S-cluster containining protein